METYIYIYDYITCIHTPHTYNTPTDNRFYYILLYSHIIISWGAKKMIKSSMQASPVYIGPSGRDRVIRDKGARHDGFDGE